jgi:hypothetical protein
MKKFAKPRERYWTTLFGEQEEAAQPGSTLELSTPAGAFYCENSWLRKRSRLSVTFSKPII